MCETPMKTTITNHAQPRPAMPSPGASPSPSTAPSDTILEAHAMPWSRKAALKGAFTSMFWYGTIITCGGGWASLQFACVQQQCRATWHGWVTSLQPWHCGAMH